MTVVVWDGASLATDRAATDGVAKWKTEKAWYHREESGGTVILSGAGPLATILAMREWYKGGALPAVMPALQLSLQWCHFLVVTPSGLYRFERSAHPIHHGFDPCAFGNGREFAFGALAMGATAERAVEICNQFVPSCGQGVAVFTLPSMLAGGV